MRTIPGYTVSQLLHEGNQTLVYRAIRDADQKKVIIKTLKNEYPTPELIAQFTREYKLFSSLQGIGTIQSYELLNTSIYTAIIMEDEGSINLKEFLKNKPLSLNDFFKIALNIIENLEAVHSHHIIHKDLNPYNILIHEADKQVKIIDFGISSVLLKEELDLQSLQRLEGMIDYVSPEQTGRMNRSIDYRTDFYSLGVTFYEMLTGTLPFKDRDILDLVHSHLAKIPESVNILQPSIPSIIGDIVNKLMAKIPENRYASAAGLKADLIECQRQWQTFGEIKPFPLGQKDPHDQLIVSQKLYGRNEEVRLLLSMFDRVSMGENLLLFVEGYSGIGKTSLVKEIYKPITRQNGYFIAGKFDQLQRSTPYSAFLEAFQELIRYLLMESEKHLAALKQLILDAIGNSGQAIIEVIPNLELIIGPQPKLPILSADATKTRFLNTLQNFIRVLAKNEHPLVIFLDDLQWIDLASLQLIDLLINDKELKYFFFIGAYRDNEVHKAHPIFQFKEKLKDQRVLFETISLKPLIEREVHHLLSDSLNMSSKEVAQFASLIMDKTQGNPFYIYEFLKRLHEAKLLTYSYKNYRWQWDLLKIENEAITDNVVDLLIARIHQLPQVAQNILELAACIGHTFDLQALKVISLEPMSIIIQAIFEATQAGFIAPINKNYQFLESTLQEFNVELLSKIEYRFQHDRIQQAAYQLIPPAIKESVHLKIGRLLLNNKSDNRTDDVTFAIIAHFNESLDLIIDSSEKIEVAKLNLWAGKKAKASAAFQSAKTYFQHGLSLIEPLDKKAINDLYFALAKELSICQFMTGEYEQATAGFNHLLSLSDLLPSIEIYRLKCQMLVLEEKSTEAIKVGLQALKKLNIHIPLRPNKFQVIWKLLRLRHKLKSYNSESKLPLMTSEYYLMVLEIISETLVSAFTAPDELLRVYLACISVELSISHGYSKSTTTPGIYITLVLLRKFKNYPEALRLSAFFMTHENQYNLAVFKCRPQFINSVFFNNFRYPLIKCHNELQLAFQYAVDEGDYYMAFAISISTVNVSIAAAKPLVDIINYVEGVESFLNNHNFERHNKYVNYFLFVLNSLKKENLAFITELSANHEATREFASRFVGCDNIIQTIAMIDCYLLGHPTEALRYGNVVLHEKVFEGSVSNIIGLFYYVLVLCAFSQNTIHQVKTIKQIQRKFKLYAEVYPENYEFYLLLIRAEVARKNKMTTRAMYLYSKATKLAESQNNFHNIGIANLCTGKFYMTINLPELAKPFLINSHYAYQHWGAKAVAKKIADDHPEWFRNLSSSNQFTPGGTTTLDTSSGFLDVLSLLKATQVISSEIQLDILLKKLIIVLIQNAGAQRGALIMKFKDMWYVAVEGTTAAQQITLNPDADKNIDHRIDLPLTLIRYVQRTKKMVQAQSVQEFESFREDPYIIEIKPQSVIVMPINYQGQLSTILFLENRNTSHAFTSEHVHVLNVLSSQAIISLENAKLYYQATHDHLTGLANRYLLHQMFDLATQRAERKNTQIALLFLDLDGFKKINDTLGHEIGDKLLIYFAERLKNCIREEDLAVRLGGDEFVVMLEGADKLQLIKIAEHLLENKDEIIIQGHQVQVGTSIGISFYPDHGQTIHELLKKADVALYQVKQAGKGRYQFYSNDLEQELNQEHPIEKDENF